VRIQIHLTEEQDRKLRTLAARRGTTRAELVRRGVDWVLRSGAGRGEDSLLSLIGAAPPGGPNDASENHDQYLYAIEEPAPACAAEPEEPYGPRK